MSHLRACMLAAVVGLIGCGSVGREVALEDLGDALRDAFCTRYVQCGVVGTEADCLALFDLDVTELVHAVTAGTVEYDGAKARECLDGLLATPCDGTTEAARVQPAACAEAIRGTIADGGACHIEQECASLRCNQPACGMACCVGTCDPTVATAAIGQSCATADCVDGAFCDGANTCQALLVAGQTCQGNGDCGYGLYCAGAGPRTCADAPNRGAACPDLFCADLGDRCDQATTLCRALSGRGGPCTTSGGGCQFGLLCDATMRCTDPPPIGQPCTGACAQGAFCSAGTCAAAKPDGQPCTGSDECLSNYCDGFLPTPSCAAQPVCI